MGTKTISVKVEEEVWDALKEKADEDDRLLTKYCARVLKDHSEGGYIDQGDE